MKPIAALIATFLLLLTVVLTAGCVTNSPTTPADQTPSLVGDAAVGTWSGIDIQVFFGSGTGDNVKTIKNYTVTIREDATGLVVCETTKEKNQFSSDKSTVEMDAKIKKVDNIYTIDAQILGEYIFTLSDDGTAELMDSDGKSCHLTRSTK